jgi:hypothetical protein
MRYKDAPGDLVVAGVSIRPNHDESGGYVPRTMAQPTSDILRGVVLVLLASWLGRGVLGFLQVLEQRVDNVVDLLLGETIFVRLTEGDTHVGHVVVAQGHAGDVGGVDGRRCMGRCGEVDGRGEEIWVGDDETVRFRCFAVFGWQPCCEPTDERREGWVELAPRLGGGSIRKREESFREGLDGHGWWMGIVGNYERWSVTNGRRRQSLFAGSLYHQAVGVTLPYPLGWFLTLLGSNSVSVAPFWAKI